MIRKIVNWYKENKAEDRLFTDKLAVGIFNLITMVALAIAFGFAFYYLITDGL